MIIGDYFPNLDPRWLKPLQWVYPYQSPSYPSWYPTWVSVTTTTTTSNKNPKPDPDPKLAIRAKDV